jgi:hypothetical protein
MNTSPSLASLSAESKLPKRKPLPQRMAGEELFITDPATGQVHFLNATAALVWECCDGAVSLQDCSERLRACFEMPKDVNLINDISDIIRLFEKQGLLEGS